MRLGECIKLCPGINPSRVDNVQSIVFYDKESFEEDFKNIEYGLETIKRESDKLKLGDVVIYLPNNQVSIVGRSGDGKFPSINFVRVETDEEKLSKEYFVYMFNSSDIIKRQIAKELQGNTIQKLSLSAINDIDVPELDIELQKKIGESYIESIKIRSKMERYGELIFKSTQQILENKVRDINERRLHKFK